MADLCCQQRLFVATFQHTIVCIGSGQQLLIKKDLLLMVANGHWQLLLFVDYFLLDLIVQLLIAWPDHVVMVFTKGCLRTATS